MTDTLQPYRAKRNFKLTPEPEQGGGAGEALSFVVQKHWASRLHYDFRLELGGTLKSWAVPKGPSYDPHDKRLAVHVEDHPLAYAGFEGRIPEHQYGAGQVVIWDKGSWMPLGDPERDYVQGNLKFELHGHKLHGRWALVRMKGKDAKQEPWLLIKEKDDYARPAQQYSVVDALPDSVRDLPPPDAAASRAHTPAAREAAGAVRAALPETLAPELATLVDQLPSNAADWLFEVKFDGYRLLTRVRGRSIKLLTRQGKDWTAKLPDLHRALAAMHLPSGWYDGEIVVLDDQGRPDFGLLQQAFDEANQQAVVYYLFDLPYHAGRDLRAVPLEQRRAMLQSLLAAAPSEQVRYSAEFDAAPEHLIAAACKLGLEGVIGKRRDSPYRHRRTSEWIKLKCGQRQEFVIGGYTDPQGARTGIGALLLGAHDEDGKLRYVGKVGSGFDTASLRDLKTRLAAIASDSSPFPAAAVAGGRQHWVKPVLVAEVSFAAWTRGGAIRHAVFRGLRSDKPAKRIVRETPQHLEDGMDSKSTADNLPAGFKLTHGERVIDAASGATKGDLVRYYAAVARLMTAHLKGRPVALVRAPAGVGGEAFFQKHADVDKLPGVRLLDTALDPGHPAMLEIGSARGLLSAAQWNVVEFHTQNALSSAYATPNRLLFDLDPGEGVAWTAMQEAAQLLHAFLDQLGLACFLKTSGGKGLHVVVPIKPEYGWDSAKRLSQAVVRHMAATLPDRFAFKSGPRNRVGRIFIDYLRNGMGATTACAWSARLRPGLGISVPLSWNELDEVTAGDHWTLHKIHARLETGNAPWSGYARQARSLRAAMDSLGLAEDKFTPNGKD